MKKIGFFKVGLLVLLLSSILISCASATPVEYASNGHYYEVISAPGITWNEAKTAAESLSYNDMSGHLATITSSGENEFIFNTFNPPLNYYLGGFQPAGSTEPDGGWQWVTGETWSTTFWSISSWFTEPDNYGAGQNYLSTFYNHGWDDCQDGMNGYIVEYEPTKTNVPEFPSIVLPIAAILGLVFIFGRKKM